MNAFGLGRVGVGSFRACVLQRSALSCGVALPLFIVLGGPVSADDFVGAPGTPGGGAGGTPTVIIDSAGIISGTDSYAGGAGGAGSGGSSGFPVGGAGGAGGMGGTGGILSEAIPSSITNQAVMNGGAGGAGGMGGTGALPGAGGNGGGGGVGMRLDTGITLTNGMSVTGGAGGAGGGGVNAGSTGSRGGNGGAGGNGIVVDANNILLNSSTITGGAGGAGAMGGNSGLSRGGNGGNGGAGGAGVTLGAPEGSANATLMNAGQIVGGAGGHGGNTGADGGTSPGGGFGGAGGAGGTGVLMAGGNSLANSGSIEGGAGGQGGLGTTLNGATLPQGDGIRVNGSGVSITNGVGGLIRGGAGINANIGTGTIAIENHGTIEGTGPLGMAITQQGNGTSALINTGTINGNVELSGYDVTLKISTTSIINGTVSAGLLSGPGPKTLELLGAGTGQYDGSYVGFNALVVDGGTWIVSGNNAFNSATVRGGTLSVAASESIGSAAARLTLDGGALENTQAFSISRNVTLGSGGGTFLTDAQLTLTGIVDGGGTLVKNGSGTLVLSGPNTYSGGTLIEAGSVSVSANESLGAPSGGITLNGGTLQVTGTAFTSTNRAINLGANGGGFDIADTANTFTIAQVLSGTGSLTKLGAGTLVLAGANSYSGGTTVSSGTLVLGSSTAAGTGAVNVLSGGLLKGSGTIGALSVGSGGMVAPGNPPGTLTVNGAVSFNAGSIYQVDVTPQGQHNLITSTGAVSINTGAGVQVLAVPGAYGPNTTYAILTTSGAVSGTFGSVSSDFAFLTPTLSYDAQNVYLTLVYDDGSNGGGGGGGSSPRFASYATTANEFAVANAAQALGIGNTLFNAIVTLPVSGVPGVFNALSGEVYPSAMSVLQDESLILRRAVLDRARVPVATPAAAPVAYAAKAPSGAAVIELPGTPDAFWAQGFGAWGRIDGNGNAATISGDVSGIIVGYDRTFFGGTGDWRLGFAAGYSSSNYRVDARSSSFSSDNAHVALYGGTSFGALGVRFGGAYSWADISADRSVVFPGFYNALSADTSARTGQVFGEVGYGLSSASVSLEPFAGLAYVNVDLSGLTEIGGSSALTGYGGSEGVTYSTLGARISVPFLLGPIPTTFKGTLAWQHAFGDITPEALFAFGPGTTPFAISGVPIASDAALIEAGLDMALSANTSLSIFYAGQLAETDTNNMVKGRFTLRF